MSTFAAFGGGEVVDVVEAWADLFVENQLGDAGSCGEGDAPGAGVVQVEEDVAAVVLVDDADVVGEGEAMLRSE